MSTKLILCLALVLTGGLFGCSTASHHQIEQVQNKNRTPNDDWTNSIPLPIPDANPSVRHGFRVHVPTEVIVKRIKGVLTMSGDPRSLEFTNLMVGSKMAIGMWCDVYVYAAGESRPTNYCHGVEGGLEPDGWKGNGANFNTQSYYWRPDGNGIATQFDHLIPWCLTHEGSVVPGKKYVVEMELTIFETDYPEYAPHWNPQSSKLYKILWQRCLKKTVE